MELNSKLILIHMGKKYANVNPKIIANARDSTMPMRLLADMILIEIAMSLVTIFTKSTLGVLTTKLSYLPIL
jgi:hypothetical protein